MKRLFSLLMLLCLLSACSGQDQIAAGQKLLDEEKFAEAEVAFNKAVGKSPDNAAAWHGRAMAKMSQGKLDSALADFNKALDLATAAKAAKEDMGKYHFNRGFNYYALAKFGSCKPDFQAAIENGYKLSEANAYLGVAYGNSDDDISALKFLAIAVKEDPKNHFAWTNRGYYNSKVGDNKTAIFDFTKAIELMPDDKVSYLNRGYTYIGMNDYPTALKDIEKALELDPEYHEAIAYKGIGLTNSGQPVEGEKWLTRAINQVPDNPALYYYRGVAFINMDSIDRGCADLAKAAAGGNYEGEGMREQYCKAAPEH
jgi:tetratricopeptide (TPR) repeat protein